MLVDSFKVNSPKVVYTDDKIEAKYTYQTTKVEVANGETTVTPVEQEYTFTTDRRVPKLGVLVVGLGGNNGTTMTAGIIANREGICWRTKEGVKTPNYFGSMVQCSTVRLAEDVFTPVKAMLPTVDPSDMILHGWDISKTNLADAMERSQVLDYDLQRQLVPYMKDIVPMPAPYYSDFIAENQAARADNILEGTKQEHVDKIRKDIRDFKEKEGVDKVIVMWSANTERFADIREGLNDTAENLLKSIANNEAEVSASTVFAVACILEGTAFINGSPQNTFVPGCVELALKHKVFIGGDDFKTGQTKFKSSLVEFLVGAGIKPTSVTSYNHLGNNDGKNLSSHKQFRSKEISKSNVVDDMVAASEGVLYKENEHPDHTVVIKYVPSVGDSKRAIDEYTSEIFMGGKSTISVYNVCEDSLLATPIIIDLITVTELMQRVTFKTAGMSEEQQFHSVLSVLSYWLKAPLVPDQTPVVNALAKQRACIENIFRACVGLPPENNMLLEFKQRPAKI